MATEQEVAAQGEKVRKLKAEKADKATVMAEVQKLIALKNELAAATGAAPVAVKQTKQQKKAASKEKKAEQPKPQKKPTADAPTDGDDPIAAQALVVRKLKADGADKAVIAAAVEKLLALKGLTPPAAKPAGPKQTNSQKKEAKRAEQKKEKAAKASNPNTKPASTAQTVQRTTTSDAAWDPLVPPGHTAFSWEDDNSEDEEEAAAPAPKAAKALLGAGCKAPAATAAAATTELDAASTAKLLGSGPTPNFAALWAKKEAAFKLDCKLLKQNKDGMLVWNVEGKGILDCTEAEQSSFERAVSQAIDSKSAGVSQGVHDKYVTCCIARKLPVGVIANGKSMYLTALSLLHGIGVACDKAKAVNMLRSATSDGCGEAMSLLGYCYQLGDGTGENQKLAAELFLAAARSGDAHGMVRLGRLYGTGVDGVLDKDEEKARALINHGTTLLEQLYRNPTSSRAEKSRALSLLHSNMNLV